MSQLTQEEATEFFSELYYGAHHIPGYGPKPYGLGWTILHDRGDLATWDFNELTRVVIMAHDKCIRVGITAEKKNVLRISIWKRRREGDMSVRHPTLEQAIEKYRRIEDVIQPKPLTQK